MYNNLSPKKCRPQEMTDLEHSIIVQTSSDEECSQILKSPIKRRRQIPKEEDPAQMHSEFSSQSFEMISKSISKRAILSLSEDGESTQETIEIADPTSSSSGSCDSSSSLFEQEGDSSEPLDKGLHVSDSRTDSLVLIKQDAEVEYRSKKRHNPLSMSSSQHPVLLSPSPVPVPSNSSVPMSLSKRPKQWASVLKKQGVPKTVLSSLPPPSTNKVVSTEFHATDSIPNDNYVPSVNKLAVTKSYLVKFENWVLSEGVSDKLCILTGPPGCGKVTNLSPVNL